MPFDVRLDGEEVHFVGEMPKQVKNALFFLEDFLKQHKRKLSKVLLNDKPLSFSDFDMQINASIALTCESTEAMDVKFLQFLENFKKNILNIKKILVSDTEQILQLAQNFIQELVKILNLLKKEYYLLSVIYEPLYCQWMQLFAQSLEDKDFGFAYDMIISLLVPLLEETQNQCL